ncbi:site-specific integrase [Xanthobacter sp. TB0136]|uniref:site-specific integrase n=1 Tax=Xanthobacter sp. TB0136 TaxID=3459177 RepID=UPI004039C207
MGTIITRKRKDGSVSYQAQILIKRNGEIVHREAQTFERKQAAAAWLEKRERRLAEPGALERVHAHDPTLGEVIRHYIEDSKRPFGDTKRQVLAAIQKFSIASLRCSQINSVAIVEFAKEKLVSGVQPQTVGNYLSHLSAIFEIAEPAWGYPLRKAEFESARVVAKRMGIIGKSKHRERRPSLDELDKILTLFRLNRRWRRTARPMQHIIAFAIFSTRRQDEITRLLWSDLDEAGGRVLVRDMKHPDDKDGNHIWCDLPDPALEIIQLLPRKAQEIFPYKSATISAAFTRACKILGIDDLHFHDLRHEGISRLFEMGLTIPHVAAVSGHRTWSSLQRYTHLRKTGDKYAGWPWLEILKVQAGGGSLESLS